MYPPQARASSLAVGAPASATGAAVLAGSAAYLSGRVTHPLCACSDLPAHGGGADLFVAYRRRPGIEALRVVVEMARGAAATSRSTAELALHAGSGSVAWHQGAGSPLHGGLDGAAELPAPSTRLADYPRFVGWLDVAALPTSETVILRVTSAQVGATGGNGAGSLSLLEVPVPSLDPAGAPTAEPGVDAGWAQSGNAIVDGSAGSPRGAGRLLRALDLARTACPRHWQITAPTSDPMIRDDLAMGPLSASSATFDDLVPPFRVRARRLRSPSVSNAVRFGAVYRYAPTYSGLADARIRMAATTIGLGGATLAQADIPLSDTGSTWTHASVAASWPCDGTGQQVELSFGAQTANTDGVSTTSDPVEIALLYVVEDET
jgi:hypothetical protein